MTKAQTAAGANGQYASGLEVVLRPTAILRHLIESATRIWGVSFWGLLFAATASSAQPTSVRLWVAPTGGISSYRMTTVNGHIRLLNPIYRPPSQLEEISGGAMFGLQLGMDLGSSWIVSAEYERLWAASRSNSSEFNLPANLFGVRCGYRLQPISRLFFGLDLGLGLIAVADGSIGNPPTISHLTGHGGTFESALDLDYLAWRRLGFLVQAGYRWARVEEVESEGSVLRFPDGTTLDVDYSGPFLRFGLRLTLY